MVKSLKYLVAILFLGLNSAFSFLNAQLSINTVINPPYPTDLDYYLDDLSNVYINITNTTATPYNFRFTATITGPAGIEANIQYLGAPIAISPGQTLLFTGNQISELGSTTGGIENTNNLSAEQLEAISLNHVLPEGNYTLCFFAYNEAEQLISDPSSGCANFTITYIERPQIVMPENDENVNSILNVVWQHDISGLNPMDRARIRYRLNLIDATLNDLGFYIDEIYDLNLAGTYQQETPNTMLSINPFTDVQLVEGHEYVCYVTAFDPDGSLMFLDRGNSNIVHFFFHQEEEDNEEDLAYTCIEEEAETQDCASPVCDFYFPSDGDTIPYSVMPLIIKFNPYCADYQRLNYEVSLRNNVSSSEIYNRSDDLRWGPGGPLQYLLDRGVTTANEERASMFMVNDTWLTPSFERSKSYTANITASMRNRSGSTFSYNLSNTFVSGMPKPGLMVPENQDTLPPGDVVFRWDNGALPLNSFPDVFYLLRMHGRTIEDAAYYGEVNERWVMQVSRTRDFNRDDIVIANTESINATHFSSVEELMSGIYIVNEKTRSFSEEGTYYYRVVWLKDPDADLTAMQVGGSSDKLYITNDAFYHSSSIREFTIDVETEPVVEEESDEGECASPCTFPAITGISPSGSITETSTFTAAGFTIAVDHLEGAGSGTGTVTLPFLNNVKIRISFTGIQINASRQMIAGTITPVIETAIPMSEHISTLGRLLSMDETAADAMEAGLETGGKLLSLLSSGSTVSLPIGIDKEISGTKIIIGITNVRILKDSASMDMVVNIKIPNLEVVNGFVSLGAQACITTNGFGNDVRLYLPQDQVLPMGNGNEFRIKGAEGASDPRNITSVEWDCNGFRALNLVGAVRFTRDWMLPESASGQILPTGNVEARFGGRFVNGGHIMVRIDMDAFQLPGAEGWGFQPGHNVWIDISDLENPTGFDTALPAHYEHASISEDSMRNTWKGFFMEELSVRTPERLQGPDRNRLTFALRNMFIDNTGITFSARAENVLRWDGDGNFNGWAVSLDTIYFDILQNNFRRAGFNGKIGLPIAEETQYLLYQAELQHRRDSFNFVMSVRPVDNIRIPISMAQAVIRNDSYIRASLGSENFIEANLCASLGIGNSNLPSGQTMPSSVRLPQIVIENLRLNSETGFDTTDFAFSLTGMEGMSRGPSSGGGGHHYEDEMYPDWMVLSEESESTMSGFPIGLDHFSFSNDRITIQPRLTLTGGDGGFSAAAKISLLVDMDLMTSPQRFDLTGVNLDRIDLDIEASDIKLSGYLEFYKTAIDEGVRGGLTLEMKLGVDVGIDINADFGCRKQAGALVYNTAEWYSYFYVDGTVVLSPGITLFSGVSLYGLGGGFYHHMRMTNDLPSGSTVMAAAGGPRAPSGVRYEPYFDTDLGLKFKVILGSNDNGKAYNLDVQLLAEFSFRHGLTLLDLKGSFRVMTDGISVSTVGRAGNSPVAGYVGMTLNLPPGGPVTFNGQFFVKVKVPYDFPVLTGLGTIPNPPPGWTAENAMVWANFYAGPDKWYFHMGNPTNRCGVRLGLGDIELMRVTNYMMIGHDIPVTMPEPDAEFVRIFERGLGSESDFTSLDGDVNSVMEGQPRPPLPLGTGFAFGMSMAMSTGDIEFFPFFFNLGAVMGCDINVTHATPETDRRCAGSDRVPGIDGWYATGQFYAGIEGAFGIKVNLFVTEIKATIFEASAAMILKGGLPNPEWVSGRGSFYYNVCDGLAEGRCSFVFEAGTVCLPVTGNPFAGFNLIQDVQPANGATDVSVYTNASAAFSMEMNRVFEIEEYVSSTDPPVIRRLQPYMYAFELKKSGSSAILPGNGNWIEENRVYDFAPINVLQANSLHTIRVEARIRENGRDLTTAGRLFREERIHEFTTGNEPDRILDENLSFTYPYIRQQHFLKGEHRANEGYVRCKRANNGFFAEGDVSSVVTTFYARFTDEDNQSFQTPVRIMRGQIGAIFQTNQLVNEKLYCVQIIRKDTPIPGAASSGTNPMLSAAVTSTVMVPSRIITSLRIINFSAVVGSNTINSNQYKRINLPGGRVNQYEREIYSYYFKTSKFNRLTEKIQAEQPDWTFSKINFGYELGKIEKNMDESFEWVDAESFKVVPQSNKTFTPRLKFFLQPIPESLDGSTATTPIPINSYLREIANRRIIQNYSRMMLERADIIRRTSNANPGSTVLCPNIMPISGFNLYDSSTGFASNSFRRAPLTQDQINSAFSSYVGVGVPGAIGNMPSFAGTPIMGMASFVAGRTKTILRYEPTVAGTEHYKQLRREAVIFANSLTTIRSSVGSSLITTYDLMTPAQKSFFDEHENRSRILDQIRYMNWTKGVQVFGIQYIYPDENGNDVLGSLGPLAFRI
ncbi:MAG TPA: hypothetical protein PLQ57_11805 [Saprospiraceae bacterium]|nr:hypothetical protein [Saprospiraceae bacterium]